MYLCVGVTPSTYDMHGEVIRPNCQQNIASQIGTHMNADYTSTRQYDHVSYFKPERGKNFLRPWRN